MTTDSDAPIPNNPPAISPADLALIALQLAARSGQPTETCFPDAHRLLVAAAHYLVEHKMPENTISEAAQKLFADQKILSFDDATAAGGPLAEHWKSRQALEQAIKRFERKKLLKSHEAKRMLEGRILGNREISSEGVKQSLDAGLIKPDEADRLLHGRQLTEADITLLLRILKRERCGSLNDEDLKQTNAQLSASIPRSAKRLKST